jgi:uncharacterized protein with von Willebrand factor type A (vWA) domain
MKSRKPLGGVIHTYQKYDPRNIPSPTQPPPDLVSGAFEHLLAYGDLRELTDEELARAVHLDPNQIAGLGPSLESLMAMLRDRKRKILATYETEGVQAEAAGRFQDLARQLRPPRNLEKRYQRAAAEEQLHELERLWYHTGDDRGQFARQLVELVARLGDKYQVDELAAKYAFTGRTRLTIPQALEIKEELETIDRLLKQLEEAAKTAQIGVIDLEELAEFAEPGDVDQLRHLARQIEEYLRQLAERQGLEKTAQGYQLTPKAYRIFQGRLLERIFSQLAPSRTGRHQGPVAGEGAVELQRTKSYEFGDSLANLDIVGTLQNALIRDGPGLPVRIRTEDIEIHRTRNTPKCATVALLDMSGSMRYNGLYVDVKRMGLALEGLIRREYPGDYLQFIEIATFAKLRQTAEIAVLLPKPVTVYDPVVHLRADMSDPRIGELDVPPHFTNIQHGLQLSRRLLGAQDTPNRQVILITDGLPTAHFEEQFLYLLYPPHRRTESATMREGQFCRREGITINIFLLPSWSQSREDVQFAYRLAESTRGRVFFTAGKDLDRYVVWDYLKRRREVVA